MGLIACLYNSSYWLRTIREFCFFMYSDYVCYLCIEQCLGHYWHSVKTWWLHEGSIGRGLYFLSLSMSQLCWTSPFGSWDTPHSFFPQILCTWNSPCLGHCGFTQQICIEGWLRGRHWCRYWAYHREQNRQWRLHPSLERRIIKENKYTIHVMSAEGKS